MPAIADATKTERPVRLSLQAMPITPSEDKDGKTRFSGLLYTGSVVMTWWGASVISLDGVEIPDRDIPCLYGHSQPVGKLKARRTDRGIEVEGELFTDGDHPSNAKAREIRDLAKAGYPWEMSIGADIDSEFIDKGESIEVNGQTIEGPLWASMSSVLREGSIVELGADANTNSQFLARAMPKPKERTMATAKLETVDTDEIDLEWIKANKPELVEALKAETETTDDEEGTEMDEVTASAATIAELEAMPGADSAFVLNAFKAKYTVAQASAELLKIATAKLEAARVELEKAKNDRGGSGVEAPATAGTQPNKAYFGGTSGTDPEADWDNSEELREHFKNHRTAFMGYAHNQKRIGEAWNRK